MYYEISGSKAPNFDACGLFRAAHSHNPPPDFDACGLFRAAHSHNPIQYSHIVGVSSHFYANIGAGAKIFHPPMSKLMWAKDLGTLASL